MTPAVRSNGSCSALFRITRECSFDDIGAMLPMAALFLPLLILSIGAALDVGRATAARQLLASAADSGALAAGRALMSGKTESEARAIALAFIDENTKTIGSYGSIASLVVTFDENSGKSTVKIVATVPTTFLKLGGFDDFTVPVTAVTQFNRTDVELAMVLDITGSMLGTKLDDLKSAANSAIDILLPAGSTSKNTRVGIVPFADGVNAGSFARTVTNNFFTPGCVHERGGSEKFSDAAPAGSGTWLGYTWSMPCPTATLLPLSTNATTLKSRINSFVAAGGTAGHIGLAWGWYIVSSRWIGIWPTESDPAQMSPKVIKAVILMTDGDFNTYYVSSNGNSEHQARQLCSNMKSSGVLVYTIAFQAPPAAEAMLKQCASSDEHYFSTSTGGALQSAFQQIANTINQLRITE